MNTNHYFYWGLSLNSPEKHNNGSQPLSEINVLLLFKRGGVYYIEIIKNEQEYFIYQ